MFEYIGKIVTIKLVPRHRIPREMENLEPKPVRASAIELYPYEIFPNDLNPNSTVFGGTVLQLMDRIAGMIAQRHSGKVCVTLFIDSVQFLAPARQGDTLIFKGAVNRVWNSSLEIGIKVFAENLRAKTSEHILSAYLTFVALDENGRPTHISPIMPETDDEKRRFEDAEKRRAHRLATGKKTK
ncbi:MAG: Long chain acyl-CoA thioester hydrolase family protein [Parcubacteria group bacterium GW2011_GWA2_47_10]|nr:MAG: Long chain acyl-CoA thioester hydrolase family protein [Parcubacteria group bacterium GW2011_GWA2_47_10]